MTYTLLRFAHVIGVTLMGAGLIGVWIADLRSRRGCRDCNGLRSGVEAAIDGELRVVDESEHAALVDYTAAVGFDRPGAPQILRNLAADFKRGNIT